MTHAGRGSTGWRTRSGLLAAVGAALAIGSIPAGAAVGPDLGAARSFAALGGSTLTNTGATTMIVGDVGVSPGSAVVGLTPSQVNGGVYIGGTTKADQAHSDAALAYNFLAGMASNANLTSTDLGGLTLSPGVYTFNSSAALTGAMFLDAGGDSSAVFVFQIATSFTTAPGSSVTVINGGADYDESNIYWQCGSSATLGTTTAFLGVIVADQSVTLETGATLTGIALAVNGAASLDSNLVTSPPLVVGPPPVTAPPINLAVVLTGTTAAPGGDLTWNDASDNETEFRLYRRDGAAPAFVLVATVLSADTMGTGALLAFSDPVLVPSTTYTYYVTAFGADLGESEPSNEALLDTGEVMPLIEAPIELTAVLGGTEEIPLADLSWTDASDNETEFLVYRRDGASPDFLLVGTVPAPDMPGTDGIVTFQDVDLVPLETYTYRVTASNPVDGESEPSNEALLGTGEGPPVRWLDLDLGRKHSYIRDRKLASGDELRIKGSYSVIDIDSGVPTVMDDLDPRASSVIIQVRAPGNVVLLTIAPNDPKWKASKKGVYRWRAREGGRRPLMTLRFDTAKSEFTLTTKRSQFASVPQNEITVSLTIAGATGSDVRAWDRPKHLEPGYKALFTVSR